MSDIGKIEEGVWFADGSGVFRLIKKPGDITVNRDEIRFHMVNGSHHDVNVANEQAKSLARMLNQISAGSIIDLEKKFNQLLGSW